VVLAPLTLAVEGLPPHLTWRNIGGFSYLSVVATGLAFVVWFGGIRKLSPAAPPLLGLAAPVTGAVLGWLALGQSLSIVQLAGFAITVSAIARGAAIGAGIGQPERRQLPATGGPVDRFALNEC